MSYTQTYHGSVSYYVSGSVSYPASEHGGSVSYSRSGSVPVDINVHVDTTPFDSSIISCTHQVAGLTGAVVTLNAAQCKSIDEASHKVADTVTHGFFNMIKSNISQDMAALLSKINSTIGLIMEKTRMVQKQQEIMQDDYSRILSRYTRVFHDLDEECRHRILQLDKDAYELSRNVLGDQITHEEAQGAVDMVTSLNEGARIDSQLKGARLKSITSKSIRTLGECVSAQSVFSNKLGDVLSTSATVEGEEYLPVLYVESDDINAQGRTSEACYIPEDVGGGCKESIATAIEGYAHTNDMPRDTSPMVGASFNRLLEDYMAHNGDQRVRDTIVKLWGER